MLPACILSYWLVIRVDPNKIVNDALFEVTYDEMVIVRDIEFYSICEHHMLPFMGRAHVAYLPSGRVIGLSKIPRIVDVFAHRLQVQERMTRQIADFINEALMPKGVAVVVEALTFVHYDARGKKAKCTNDNFCCSWCISKKYGYTAGIFG